MDPLPSRSQQLARLKKETFDLLVIGGGATGTGIAVDAASRGLKVALVERDDFASGTSSRSTKLIHGGVRYLEDAIKHFDRDELHLVTDALHERKTLLTLAPHLAHPLPLVTPLYSWMDVPYYLAGLKIYDWISRKASLGHSTFLTPQQALETFPLLNPEGLKGAVLYYDGQFNDARMNVTLALTAARQGAAIANHAEVTQLLKEEGRLTGTTIRDTLTGESFVLSAHTTINATGPFSDAILQLDGHTGPPMITPSRGVHIVLDKLFSPPGTGLLIPHTEDGRVLFLLPWEGFTLAGTTDAPGKTETLPRALPDEIDYILQHINATFALEIEPSQVKASWVGIRPLAHASADTASITRDHVITKSASGLVTIAGGKWTTYRLMAKEAVETAFPKIGSCRTDTLPLEGAIGYSQNEPLPYSEEIATHLHHAYGAHARHLPPGKRLLEALPYLDSEIEWAVTHEYACTAIDVLARRMRLAFLDPTQTLALLPLTIEKMGTLLNWSTERRAQELDNATEFLSTMGANVVHTHHRI